MMSLCESSQNHSSIGHVVVRCSFDSIISYVFFIIFHLSYNTSDLSNTFRACSRMSSVKHRRLQLGTSRRNTICSNFGAPGQLSPATSAIPEPSPATSALPVNPSNFGAPGQPSPVTSALPVNPHQQLRRSRSAFASNFGAPGQPSPATSALPVSLCQQLRCSRSTFASNFGAPGQPSPATSALPVLPVNIRQQLRRSWSTFASNFGAPGATFASNFGRTL